jgi:hypothetical protein
MIKKIKILLLHKMNKPMTKIKIKNKNNNMMKKMMKN